MQKFDYLKYLDSLNETKIELGLSRIKKVLALLGNIQNKLKIIHVAGTNGKGSTSTLINNIFINDCKNIKKTGLFTSPHIYKINERIKINNQEISDLALKNYIRFFKNFLKKHSIQLTYFEFLTAICIKYFYDNSVDVAVFECGLGGRLDSTNVFAPKNTLVSVITNIDFDHCEYLGNSLTKILNEKMGILKKNVPIVSAVSQLSLRTKLQNRALKLNSDLFLIDKDFLVDVMGVFKNLKLRIRGEHQKINVSIVLMVIKILKEKYGYEFYSDSSIKNTIKNFELNGRLEFIAHTKNNFGTNFILDVGHNFSGIKSCVDYLKVIKKNYENLVMVFGVLRDKDYDKCSREILKIGNFFYLTSPQSNRALCIDDLEKKFTGHGYSKKVKLASKNYDAILKDIKQTFSKKDLVCIVGSFYLISEFRKKLIK